MQFLMKLLGFGASANRLNKAKEQVSGESTRIARREAQRLRKIMVQQFRKQAPASGGHKWPPHSPLTKAERKISGKGDKMMIRSGELRNSIAVIDIDNGAFVGIPRAATGRGRRPRPRMTKSGKIRRRKTSTRKTGRPVRLVRLAEIMEYGKEAYAIKMTAAMRGWLFGVLFKHSGTRSGTTGKRPGYVVVSIPPRPFARPAFDEWERTLKDQNRDHINAMLKGLK